MQVCVVLRILPQCLDRVMSCRMRRLDMLCAFRCHTAYRGDGWVVLFCYLCPRRPFVRWYLRRINKSMSS